MLTTTPRFSPCAGALPRPAMRSSPPGSTSATTTITFAVPMSRPTTRSLYSLGIFASSLLFLGRLAAHVDRRRHTLEPHCIPFVVTQIGVFDRPLITLRHLRHGADESTRAFDHLVVAAAA